MKFVLLFVIVGAAVAFAYAGYTNLAENNEAQYFSQLRAELKECNSLPFEKLFEQTQCHKKVAKEIIETVPDYKSKITKILPNSTYLVCHEFFHAFADVLFEKFKDADKTLDACPRNEYSCFGGCEMGVIEMLGYTSGAEKAKEYVDATSDNRLLSYFTHALGHAIYAENVYDFHSARYHSNSTANSNHILEKVGGWQKAWESCKTTYQSLCFEGIAHVTMLRLFLSGEQNSTSIASSFSKCDFLPDKENCYKRLSHFVGHVNAFYNVSERSVCEKVPADYRAQCLANFDTPVFRVSFE